MAWLHMGDWPLDKPVMNHLSNAYIHCLHTLKLVTLWTYFNSLRPKRNRRHFADNIFKWKLLNENVFIFD